MSLEFHRVDGHVRSVYRQMDDSLIPASECKCRADWNKIGFFVCFALDCPIDEHAMKARQGDFDETT